MLKRLAITMFLISGLIGFSGCFNTRSVEDLAYVTAIGIDLIDDNNLELTFQIMVPNSSSSTNSESNQSSKTEAISIKSTTINSGLSLINSYVSKQIDLSHCKAIIISSNLASCGITPYIDTLIRNTEIRPNCNIIISKCSAKDYINNSKPTIESLASKYYEIAIKSSYYTGYIPSTTLIELAR